MAAGWTSKRRVMNRKNFSPVSDGWMERASDATPETYVYMVAAKSYVMDNVGFYTTAGRRRREVNAGRVAIDGADVDAELSRAERRRLIFGYSATTSSYSLSYP